MSYPVIPLSVRRSIQELNPSALLELYDIDLSAIPGAEGEPPFPWHAGTNELDGPVVFDGVTYTPMPIRVTGFETTSQGTQPRPLMSIAAFARDTSGRRISLSALIRSLGGLEGARVRRIQVHVKHVDAVNFASGVNPTADPTAVYPIEEYFVDRKAGDSPLQLDYELANVMDMRNAMVPNGQVNATMCPPRTVYRGELCGYTDDRYFDADDNPVSDPALDTCSRRPSGCLCRHTVPTTYEQLTDRDYAAFAAEVMATGKLFNSAQAIAEGHTTWPDGWYRTGDLNIVRTARGTLKAAPAFVSNDIGFSGVPKSVEGPMLFIGGNLHETRAADLPATAGLALWLQLIRGTLPSGCSIVIKLRRLDSARRNWTLQTLLTIPVADLKNFTLYSATVTPGGPFAYTYYDSDLGERDDTADTYWLRLEIHLHVNGTDVELKDGDGWVYQNGSQLDFTLRIAMPYLGAVTDFAPFTYQELQTISTTKVLPLPFGGFPGAELFHG